MPEKSHDTRWDTYWREMEEDPDFRLCKREARLGALTGTAFFGYVVIVIYFLGFRRQPDEYKMILGMPDWLVLGQFLPTAVLVVVVIVFAKRVMKPLAEETQAERPAMRTEASDVSDTPASLPPARQT